MQVFHACCVKWLVFVDVSEELLHKQVLLFAIIVGYAVDHTFAVVVSVAVHDGAMMFVAVECFGNPFS